MKRVVLIFCRRWPEITLLLGFQTGLAMLADNIERTGQTEGLSPGRGLLLIAGTTALLVIWEMLFLGFLRTAATTGARQSEPITLLRTGKTFFWKIALYQVILSIGYIGLANLVLAGLAAAMKIDDVEKLPAWTMQAAGLAALAMLIKPMLVMPSAIIVRDCSIADAVGTMRQYRMFGDRRFVLLTVAGLAVIAAATAGTQLIKSGAAYYAVAVICTTVSGLILLAMFLAVVMRLAGMERQKKKA